MTDTARHDYPTLIAHSFAGLPTDQQTPEGFVSHRAAMRKTFLKMFRAEGMDPGALGSELGNFAFAADCFEEERFGRIVTPPAPQSEYDYPDLIESWFDSLAKDQQTPEGIAEHRDIIRSSISRSMADAGLNRDALARELALFDAAAKAFLRATYGDIAARMTVSSKASAKARKPDPDAAKPPTTHQDAASAHRTPSAVAPLPGLDAPLGAWRWVGVVWLAGGWAAGAGGALMALLAPRLDLGQIGLISFLTAAACLSAIVLAAAIPLLARTVRRYRGVGFAFFWLPMILFSVGLATVPQQLVMQLTNDMGPDFLPLSLPLSFALFAAVAMPSLWLIGRRFRGLVKPLTEAASDDRIHPVMAVLLSGFSVLFFSTGASVMLKWGPGPALIVGIFVTGIVIRIFRDREIGIAFVLVTAVPLALVATELPPGNLSVLTVLTLAAAASIGATLITLLRGTRRKTFVSGLTAAALALLLVMAPTGPSPATRAAEWTGHAARPLADRLMHIHAAIYRTAYGQPILAMLGGFRSGAAETQVVDYSDADGVLEMSVQVRNLGERGLSILRIDMIGDGTLDTGLNTCRRPVVDQAIDPPIWPGEQRVLMLRWAPPKDCHAETFAEIAEQVRSGMDRRTGGGIPWLVLQTQEVDPAELFRKDGRTWLGL